MAAVQGFVKNVCHLQGVLFHKRSWRRNTWPSDCVTWTRWSDWPGARWSSARLVTQLVKWSNISYRRSASRTSFWPKASRSRHRRTSTPPTWTVTTSCCSRSGSSGRSPCKLNLSWSCWNIQYMQLKYCLKCWIIFILKATVTHHRIEFLRSQWVFNHKF